jgi:hypothetical protein
MKFFPSAIVLLLLAIVLHAGAADPGADSLPLGRYPGNDSDTVTVAKLRLYDPEAVAGASFIVPGLGQITTQHYIRPVFFLAAESILASMTYFWNQTAIGSEQTVGDYIALSQGDVPHGLTVIDSAEDVERARLQHYSTLTSRFSAYNYLTWLIGAHIYNVLDAVDCSNHFKDEEPRSAGKAFWLATIPGLGLGQIYNGDWSKAGIIIMGQWSLGMMAFNNQRLMIVAQDNFARLNTPLADSANEAIRSQVATDLSQEWSSARYSAFSNRNMFLWYSIFFYGYSIFDAVVDAYLHDYNSKMNIKPDLAVGMKSVEFSLRTDF